LKRQSQVQGADLAVNAIALIEQQLSVDPRKAESLAAELLLINPGHQLTQLLQGIAIRLQGDQVRAIAILEPLSRSCPDAPLVHLQLGLAYRETGRVAEAAAEMRAAVAAKPDFSDAWLALADVLISTGDGVGANLAFLEYARHGAHDPALTRPATALREKRIDEAENLLRNHLEAQPNDIIAISLLADVADRRDNMREAEALLKRCLELAPGYRRARHNYAVVLLRQNRTVEALAQTKQLLVDDPRNPEVRKLKSAILVRQRDYDESIRICTDLLQDQPDQPTVWTSLGHMLKSVGRREECIEAYRKAMQIAPCYGEPYWSLANLKTLQLSDQDLAIMLDQVNAPGVTENDRLHFHFAIGKALEDRGCFAESFHHYEQGNALRRRDKAYHPEELEAHIRRSQTLLTPEFFKERSRFGHAATDPIFILGLPRSGSTLVEQILASHSTVEGTMELPEIAAIAKSLDMWRPRAESPGYPEILAELGQDSFRELGLAYIEQTRIQRKSGRPRFIDKMPNNFAHIGLIHLILPEARIIDVRRHPMACGFSLFKEHFAHSQNFSYNLEHIGRYYRNYVELMAHFDSVLPGRVHRIFYERMVADTENEIRRLLEYCGLPFESECLAFHDNKRPVSTASSEQVRSPIYKKALEHWRHYEPWLGPLKRALGSQLEDYPY
jgi:tetratricopeptide (TPR) repeat protein